MGAHTTSDDPTRYRLAAELEAWKLKDPIERVKAYLIRGAMTDASFFEGIEQEAAELGTQIRRACLSMPDPPPAQIFEHVYAEPHPLVEAEREQFTAYLSSLADEEGTR